MSMSVAELRIVGWRFSYIYS